MKESANIALNYVKANAKEFNIDFDFFNNNDMHIHVPEGAIPKDGPSAGITLTTALISSITGLPVLHHIGMTGEITLRGNVLPIGGLKEKTISAHRSGLKSVIIPEKNAKDWEEVPKEISENLKVNYVKHYEEVYNIVFKNTITNSEKKSSDYRVTPQ